MYELAANGTSGLALLVASWKRLARRDDEHSKAEEKRRDEAFKTIFDAIRELRTEMREQLTDLGREIRHLRETDISQAAQIGALQEGIKGLEKRIDGQSAEHRVEMDRIAPRKLRDE